MNLGEALKAKINRMNVPILNVTFTPPADRLLCSREPSSTQLIELAEVTGDITKYRLAVIVAYQENYAFPDWDGKGICPAYWKNKASDDEVVTEYDSLPTYAQVLADFESCKSKLEWDNSASRQSVLRWELLAPNTLTGTELMIAECKGGC